MTELDPVDPSSVNVPRSALLELADWWEKEYVTDDGWPLICANQLRDVVKKAAKNLAPVPVSDEAEADELRQLASAYLAAWGGGIPKLWHDAFTALGIEPMDDIQAAFDLAQSLAARGEEV